MALLASCWLIVESFIIPDGFLKWFYLSFYIHPLFLAFCQIFLWLKILKKWLLFFFFPFRIAYRLNLFVFRFLKRVAIFLLSFTRLTTVEVFYDVLEPDIPTQDREIVVSRSSRWNSTCSSCQVVHKTGVQSGVFEMGDVWKVGSNLDTYEATEEKDHNSSIKDSWLNEYLYSDHYNSSILTNAVDMSERLFSSEGIVSSPTEILPDQHDSALFYFSLMDQSVDFKSHEGISGFVSLSKLKTSPSSINQEFIHESEDSVVSPSHCCDPQLLEDMLTIAQEGSVSPVSNFDLNDSLSTTDDFYTISAADMLVDHEYLPAFCGSNSPVSALKQQLNGRSIQEDVDPFHQKYTSRMRFFNVLHHERLYGMKTILNEHLTIPGVFKSTESSTDNPMQHIIWSRMARKRLLSSLECDLEMIYVAQSCLFWEALHHQYQKVEALTSSDNSENIVFHQSVSGKFQELQILLERFVEDQKCECQRSSNNTHKRLSFLGLLQVPDATGFAFMEEENKRMGGEGIRATQLLEAIDNCIKAFWLYLKTDNQKSLWKYKGIWRTHPPVEDPQDLELLYNVTKTLHKKGIMVKDLQGKSKCWIRRKVKPLQAEDEKRNLLFAMIDMKLVQRLLRMSLVSASHLKWCQEKLNNLDFKEGKVFRGPIIHLFPSS